MSFWSNIAKGLGIAGAGIATGLTGGAAAPLLPLALGAGGAALGAFSQGQATNRGEKFGGQLELEQLLMDRDRQLFDQRVARETEGRTGQSDAWRKLLAGSRTLSPGTRPQLSPYSKAPRGITAQEQTGADALVQEALARLQGGNPIPAVTQRPVNVDPKLLDAGLWENIAGAAGPGLAFWSMLKQPKAKA